MLWTCPKCQTENPNSLLYCQICGERKVGEKPIKTSASTEYSAFKESTIEYSKNAEQSFSRYLKPISFSSLQGYATAAMVIGFLFYILAVILFILSLKEGLGLWDSTLLTLAPIGSGFVFQLISEIVTLFLHGQESWFLSAKYNYVNSELTNELLKKIESLEDQVSKLSSNSTEKIR